MLKLLIHASLLLSMCLSKPNILIYMVDDLGQGEFNQQSFNNSFLLYPVDQEQKQLINTPNLEKLSKGSENYHHVWTSPVCGPSRYSLLTSQEILSNSIIKGNEDLGNKIDWNNHIYNDSILTNYTTGYVGKFGFGNPYKKLKLDYYFGPDYIDREDTHILSHSLFPYKMAENGDILTYSNNKKTNKKRCLFRKRCTYAPDTFLEKSKKFITTTQEPWFLIHSTTLNHVGKWSSRSKKYTYPVNKIDSRTKNIKFFDRKAHLTMTYMIDNEIGELLDIIPENTIFVFITDNGSEMEFLKGKPIYPSYFTSTGYRKGQKRSYYEGGINVPMMIKWPNGEKANTHNYNPIAFHDIKDLIMSYFGKDYVYKDYLRMVYCEKSCINMLMRTKDKMKLIKRNSRLELYDLINDPKEEYPLQNIPRDMIRLINF